MKKKIITIFSMALASISIAQTTAQDWTLTDCNSVSHTLFTYLDAEEVVVMEFGMGCGSCYTAANGLYILKLKYAADQPGKVNFFYLDYWAGNTCVGEVNPVLATSPLDAGFINCQPQLSYYMSGSPMPAVVIVAGSNHAVIYEKSSFAYSDTTNMITVIDNFFASVGINDVNDDSKIKMYPNPATNSLTIENASQSQFSVYDAAGKLIYSAMINDEVWTLNTDFLPAGIYVTEFVNDLNFESQRLVVE